MTEPPPLNTPRRHVAVIGAGIVGGCVALGLVRRGGATIVEPAETRRRGAASYGNSAFISPASVVP